MRFSVGNINGKALGLNANELCVAEAIAKCSRTDNAKGWYGSMKALAEVLPFDVSKASVVRAVQKLTELGLIVRKDNALFAVQNEPLSVQNEPQSVQNEPVSHPPYTPLDNINNNINLSDNNPCARATDGKGLFFMNYSFDIFWKAFRPSRDMDTRKEKLRLKWDNEYSRAKKHFIMQDLFAHEAQNTLTSERNPWFYCENFNVPPPYNWNGDPAGMSLLKQGKLASAAYNGRFGTYSLEDIELYALQLPPK